MESPVSPQQQGLDGSSNPQDIVPLNIPAYYVSVAQVSIAGNDCLLTLSAPRPGFHRPTGTLAQFVVNQPSCLIQLSMRTAKDLYLLLGGMITQYEEVWGKVETEFSRSYTTSTTQKQ
jgi:hypothetical protein